jgi:hypothetical protein
MPPEVALIHGTNDPFLVPYQHPRSRCYRIHEAPRSSNTSI